MVHDRVPGLKRHFRTKVEGDADMDSRAATDVKLASYSTALISHFLRGRSSKPSRFR